MTGKEDEGASEGKGKEVARRDRDRKEKPRDSARAAEKRRKRACVLIGHSMGYVPD